MELTPIEQELADHFHQEIYGPDAGSHENIHSCPCSHLARYWRDSFVAEYVAGATEPTPELELLVRRICNRCGFTTTTAKTRCWLPEPSGASCGGRMKESP